MGTSDLPQPSWRTWHDDEEPIRLGISSCLLGAKVRFDGGHKHDRYLTGVLGEWVEWVAVCPEVGIKLGTPRPTIRLELADQQPRLIMPSTGDDLTDKMERYSRNKVQQLKKRKLDGFVLKRASPTCGMERVKVYGKGGSPAKNGVGVFARILMESMPNLPVEEEGRLNDPVLRERFIQHVFCTHRWRSMEAKGLSRRRLVAFHTAHKLILRSHNEAAYRRLGRIVASAGTMPDEELYCSYEDEFHRALNTKATSKRHANVLYHALGYLKRVLDRFEKKELVQIIEDYRNGLVPLVVPITLLRHHVTRHQVAYLMGQLYLEPHPKELMLRNRV
jgi:uncharacterized protein YbgA (DUF1722 family)/uncharacterized protein YbbK (DUF523 family)